MDYDELPCRDNDIYKEVEKFQTYELIPCIVYEMAIRNDNAKEMLDELNDLNKIRENTLNPSKYSDSQTINGYKRYSVWRPDHQEEFDELAEKIIDEYLIYPTGYEKRITDFDNYLVIKEALYNNDKPEHAYKSNQSKNDGFIISQGIYKKDVTFDISYIHTDFKRHIYDINQTHVALNFSLPEDELIAYIKHIKKTLSSSSEKKLKLPMELLSEELKIETINFKNMTTKEWADCFFIYDYFNSSLDNTKASKEQKLQELLTEHHGFKIEKTKQELKQGKNKGNNSRYKIVSYEVYQELKDEIYDGKGFKSFYSTKTINDRLKLMTALIDDLRYKTLIIN